MLGRAYGSAEIRHSLRRIPSSVESQDVSSRASNHEIGLLALSFERECREGQSTLLRDYAAGMAAMVRSILHEDQVAALQTAEEHVPAEQSLRLILRMGVPPPPQPQSPQPHIVEAPIGPNLVTLPEAA